jgi:DNA-binding FadR family transcriptional regulator
VPDSRGLIALAVAAAERIGSSDVAAFRQRLSDETKLLGERGPAARRAEIRATDDFRLLLAEVAGNVVLQRFMDELIARSSLVIALYGRTRASSCDHADHATIFTALGASRRSRKRAASLSTTSATSKPTSTSASPTAWPSSTRCPPVEKPGPENPTDLQVRIPGVANLSLHRAM